MTRATRRRARTIGLLPPLGGSLTSLADAGQIARLVDFYLPAYLERFDRVLFFSSLDEPLAGFTDDPDLRSRTEVVAPLLGRNGRAADLARLFHRRALERCSVLRALQAPGGLAALGCRVPLVVTYGYSYQEVSRFVGRPRPAEAARQAALGGLLRAVLRRAQVTLVTNPALTEEARRLGARRIAVIPNGVPLGLFTPAPRARRTRYDVIFLGRLSSEKNPGLIARAAAHLERPLRVCFVGDGPLRGELDAELARSGCEVDFLGTRAYRELPELLRSAAVFVLPSATEGRAKALLEAMACALPCVVTDIPSFADIAAAGAVVPFPPDDDRALAAVLGRLLADPAERRQQGRAGRRYVETTASLEGALLEEGQMLAAVASGRYAA